MARSTRQRKPVNYRRLLRGASDGSDDDFESAPPSKKSRGGGPVENSFSSDKNRGKDAQTKSTADKEEVTKKPGRLSRDEKAFTKQIERALKASTTDSNDSVSICSDSSEAVSSSAVKSTVTEESKDGEFIPNQTDCPSGESEDESYSEENEDSDFTASPETPKKVKKSTKENVKSTSKAKQVKIKKQSTKPEVNTDRVSSEPSPAKVTKSIATKVTNIKSQTPKSSPLASKTCLSGAKAAPLCSSRTEGGSPAVLGVNKRTNNWTPPAKVGVGKTDSCTPNLTRVHGSGGGTPLIRVGLSRNARVKSLHTNIKT